MKGSRSGTRLLRLLAGVTAAALAGIVALQVYWLSTLYTEQRTRFRADVENALATTIIRSQIDAAMSKMKDVPGMEQFGPVLTEVLSSIAPQLPKLARSAQSGTPPAKKPTVVFSMNDAVGVDTTFLHRLSRPATGQEQLEILGFQMDDSNAHPLALKPTFEKLKAELRKRSIETPVALAISDSTGRLLQATCDTAVFKDISVKSELSASELTADNTRLQAAFPAANLYLLRRMAWILSLTALLLLLCAASFAWLLRLFFRQKRLDAIRNDFLNNMTHELKTPIASVSVALELVRDTRRPVSEVKKSEYLDAAQSELRRLTLLVDKVLKMAAFERSEIRIAPEDFLAAPWLQGILASLQPAFERSGAVVTASVQPELLLLHADKTHLTNVVQNLLENALKYHGGESPQVAVRIAAEGDNILLAVTDDGKGIPAAYLGKVFDKFFRVPAGNRHDTQGYGLGLSYVKAVAELHGGTATVASEPGTATTFTVTLPRKSA